MNKRHSGKHAKIITLCLRLDHYCELAEACRPGSKMRARHYAAAQTAREKLRLLDH